MNAELQRRVRMLHTLPGYAEIKIGHHWLSFEEARAIVRSFRLKNIDQWRSCYSTNRLEQRDIPRCPWAVYKKEWKGRGDWFGTERPVPGTFLSFHKARKFARSLKLKSVNEWWMYCKSGKKPIMLPTNPHRTYTKEWRGMVDFLGTSNLGPKDYEYRSFREARKFARQLGLRTWEEWQTYAASGKRPLDIPSNPNAQYKNSGWKNLADWLGVTSSK